MLVDTIGLGLIIPVTPAIIKELTGDTLSAAAGWGGWLMFVFALMQFLCAPLIGNLSDRYGRRPVLIVSLIALAVDYTITGWAPTIWWLFLGRFLSGVAGATYPTVNAYIADVSPPEKRAANFGLTGAAFGVGFILGPALGGVIGEHFGPHAPFFAAAGIALLNALFGLVVLKESLPPAQRRPFEVGRANPLGALKSLGRFPMMYGLLGVGVLLQLAHDSLPATWTYYTMLKFNWGPGDVAWSLVGVGVTTAVSFAVLPRLVVPRLGEGGAVYFGLFFAALGYAVYAFAVAPWMMYAGMVVWALGGAGGPALNAIMSHAVPANQQGELMGARGSLDSITSIIAPLMMTGLFKYFTSGHAFIYFAGASFLAAALFEFGGLALFATTRPRTRTEPVPAG
ncbi:MAG: TCR/Tet family MFS transporter [Alphaproteobacteria bacterium]|nr:TCR/Tet family MFS transporter [Alphaproteobacteria bacterium]MBL6940023.1 TCR/Tet family MFS transporter [Alphaproteobacteria bacterium]MBL7098121.1 TCR/Tet family MFS transporter [Alphaproteobacteria bacterium]